MTPWVKRLLIANVVMFVITINVPALFWGLALVPIQVPFRPWTVITYMFLHGGLGHIFFNMIGLFFFGPRLEQKLGGRHFILFYFVSGMVGAALSILTPRVPIVGASGAVFGVLLGFARYWPRDKIYIWGILPIQARVLVVILAAASLWSGLSGAGAGVAHFTHLGGFLGGYLYLKWMEYHSPARQFKRKMAVAEQSVLRGSGDMKRWSQIARDDLHPINREELDRILEKIKSTGVGSLKPDEIAFLNRFSQQ